MIIFRCISQGCRPSRCILAGCSGIEERMDRSVFVCRSIFEGRCLWPRDVVYCGWTRLIRRVDVVLLCCFFLFSGFSVTVLRSAGLSSLIGISVICPASSILFGMHSFLATIESGFMLDMYPSRNPCCTCLTYLVSIYGRITLAFLHAQYNPTQHHLVKDAYGPLITD